MPGTDNLRQHHRELLRIASNLRGLLNAERIKKDAGAVTDALSALSGKLAVHLAMEDDSLYPALVNHRDRTVKSLAQRFARDAGPVRSAFTEYSRKWATPANIQSNPNEFVLDTKNIFGTLSKRIEREDLCLYSVIDRLNFKKAA